MRTVLDNGNGVQTVVALEDGALVTGTIQDATPIAEVTKALHNEGHHGSSDFKVAAEIPVVFVEEYLNRNGITLQDFLRSQEHKRRLLNDPALSAFRIWKGRI